MDSTSFPEALSSHMILQPDSAFFFPALRPKAVFFTLRVFFTRHTKLPQECAGLNCVHAHTDPISLGSQPGFVTRFSEKRVSSNRPPGLSRSSQPAPLLSPHLLLGGELSDRETSGRVAVTVPADACGQRRIRSRTRKLPILPDRSPAAPHTTSGARAAALQQAQTASPVTVPPQLACSNMRCACAWSTTSAPTSKTSTTARLPV